MYDTLVPELLLRINKGEGEYACTEPLNKRLYSAIHCSTEKMLSDHMRKAVLDSQQLILVLHTQQMLLQ